MKPLKTGAIYNKDKAVLELQADLALFTMKKLEAKLKKEGKLGVFSYEKSVISSTFIFGESPIVKHLDNPLIMKFRDSDN